MVCVAEKGLKCKSLGFRATTPSVSQEMNAGQHSSSVLLRLSFHLEVSKEC